MLDEITLLQLITQCDLGPLCPDLRTAAFVSVAAGLGTQSAARSRSVRGRCRSAMVVTARRSFNPPGYRQAGAMVASCICRSRGERRVGCKHPEQQHHYQRVGGDTMHGMAKEPGVRGGRCGRPSSKPPQDYKADPHKHRGVPDYAQSPVTGITRTWPPGAPGGLVCPPAPNVLRSATYNVRFQT